MYCIDKLLGILILGALILGKHMYERIQVTISNVSLQNRISGFNRHMMIKMLHRILFALKQE